MDTQTGEIFHPSAPMDRGARRRMERARRRGHLVEVSEAVATRMEIGSRVEQRRQERQALKAKRRAGLPVRKRKAAKAARRKNR